MNITQQISNINLTDLFNDVDFIKIKKLKDTLYFNNTLSIDYSSEYFNFERDLFTRIQSEICLGIHNGISKHCLDKSNKYDYIDLSNECKNHLEKSLLEQMSLNIVHDLIQMFDGYDNIICSRWIGNILRCVFTEYYMVKLDAAKTTRMGYSNIYTIGSLSKTKVWIDPTIPYSETRIIALNSIYLDIENTCHEINNETKSKLIINSNIHHTNIDSKIIYILSSISNDDVINKWKSINRDKKINNLLNE